MRSDRRLLIVDLTNDDSTDDEDELLPSLSGASVPTRINVPQRTDSRRSSIPVNTTRQIRGPIPLSDSTQAETDTLGTHERAAKRLKSSSVDWPLPAPQGLQHAVDIPAKANATNGRLEAGNGPPRPDVEDTRTRYFAKVCSSVDMDGRRDISDRNASIQDLDPAPKTNGSGLPIVPDLAAQKARVPEMIPASQEASVIDDMSLRYTIAADSLPIAFPVPLQAHQHTHVYGESQRHTNHDATRGATAKTTTGANEVMTQMHAQGHDFSGPLEISSSDDKDSVMSDISSESEQEAQQPAEQITASSRSLAAPVPSIAVQPPKSHSSHKKSKNHFTEEQDHYLIFLKEVRGCSWAQITADFNAEFPPRAYHNLQSRYSQCLNKRNRSQDPMTLSLPRRFAAEAAVDWQTVHANHPGPRPKLELNGLRHAPSARQPQRPGYMATRPFPVHQTIEQDFPSRSVSAPRRQRPHRAERVNYTLPRFRRRTDGTSTEHVEENEAVFEDRADSDSYTGSEMPTEEDALAIDATVAVDNPPMDIGYNALEAQLALAACKGSSTWLRNLPYLTSLQRSTVQDVTVGWDWDQSSSRQWQGSVLHVDFSPTEIEVVHNSAANINGSSRVSRHSTQRRQLRHILRNITDSHFLQLVAEVQSRLPCRDRASITAFLHDAKSGKITDAPQVKRLAAARPQTSMCTRHKSSTCTILHQRELGRYSRRGWKAASKPLTYQIKNKYMDTMGPTFTWTGASSDIHSLAWAPNGECFAAGAVAVDDPHSMQYNRPNNLLFGNASKGLIHELGEHTRKREKTETGANSTHAMFVSQDPRVYATVSSVAFSTSGKIMYSAGYDETICAWQIETESLRPVLGTKINFKAQIDMITVNRIHPGFLATAAKIAESKAIRLLKVNEDEPSKLEKYSFQSSKAVSRSDLKILPTALQFEPSYGGLLLAGFGANVRDSGFDMTGDLCLWDVETQTQLNIHGSNRNIFDVEFNPNRSNMPLFAAGCVAGGNVNRGTRSLLRLYDEKVDKFRCPLEIECKALDMNDIVWCPYDEHLIAAGCTDGRAYVWDVRWPNDPIHVLSHGRSSMALQDGVPPEVSDTGVRFLSWGENATRLYSGSSDGIVKVWDVTRSEENVFIRDLVSFDSGIMSGAFSPDMSKLVLGEVSGSVNVLQVGSDDRTVKDAEILRYVPYDDEEEAARIPVDSSQTHSGIAEANHLLQTGQIELAPFGGLPIRQAVQGQQYIGPFDRKFDAPFLREQALEFQQSLVVAPGPQCDIAACNDTVKVTSEEIGDSERSADRIPDELRRQWKVNDSPLGLVPGKSRCSHCGRPARPSSFDTPNTNASILCERCSFSCLRCGSDNPLAPATSTLICDSCAGVWDVGSLGYECVQQPIAAGASLTVPLLQRWGKEAYMEKLGDVETSFGDEVNALTDYYHSQATDRPDSPPL